MSKKEPIVRRYLIPLTAFLLGASLIAVIYFGILLWAQGWDSAESLFLIVNADVASRTFEWDLK
jgi:hypothetical protein